MPSPNFKNNNNDNAKNNKNDMNDDAVAQVNGGDPSYMADVSGTMTPYVHDDADPDLNKQIESLKAALHVKEEQMLDLQQGLQAQVQMVMELEALEQTEVADYQAKLDANRRLIDELGERVGSEAKDKAELETRLAFTERKLQDQTDHVEHLQVLNRSHVQILQQMNARDPNAVTPNSPAHLKQQNSAWQVYTKVEELMRKNLELTSALQQANDAKHDVQQQVLDKELLCLELSSQLDKLAVQLNHEDELMAQVKQQLQDKTRECKVAQDRVAFLEAAWEEGLEDDDQDDQSPSLLFQKLQETESKLAQTTKTRDAALAKASKLSVALAKTRERADWLQNKVDYQNSIVEKILGKGALEHLQQHSTATKAHGSGKTNANHTTANNATNNNLSFDGSRIRNLWKNATNPTGTGSTDANTGSASNNKASPTNASSSQAASTSSGAANDTTAASGALRTKIGQLGDLVRRAKPLRTLSIGKSNSNNNSGHSSTPASTAGATTSPRNSAGSPATNTVDNEKPIKLEDDLNFRSDHHPINPTVGLPTEVEENVQGGGGDVSQSLTV